MLEKAVAVLGLLTLSVSIAHAGDPPLTRQQLEDGNKIVMTMYPGPYAKTFATVVKQLGKPKKVEANMSYWYAQDAGKCIALFMTKAAQQGHAASGLMDATASDRK